MNKLYASTIEMILLDLDLAIKHSDCPEVVEDRVTSAKQRLLRAALADVEVEPAHGSSLLDAFHPRELAHARASG